MSTIQSTPAMAAKTYEMMDRNLEVVRRRLGTPLTLSDKILLGHADDPETQDMVPGKSYLFLRPDRVMMQDVLGQTGMLQFMQTGKEQVEVPTTIHCDHLIQAWGNGASDLRESIAENCGVYDFLASAAAKYGVGFWKPGAGINHQVALENYAYPGALMIGADSHTPNAGGLGACACGVGGADAVEVMAGLPWEVLYPKHIAVYLSGELSGWTAPKDVILKVAGELTVSGGTNAINEYIGPGARTISATGKATTTNMGAEVGATTSLFPYDDHMATYLGATGRAELAALADKHRNLLAPDTEIEAEPDQYYDRVIRIDLSSLEPHVVGPHSPDRARPLSVLAAEIADPANGFEDAVSSALIGSCTKSSYEDMSRAADIAGQAAMHGMKATTPLLVTPGSEQIRATTARDGQLRTLEDAGGTVLANACGPCIGQWRRAASETEAPNTIVTSYNRNFPKRNDGRPTSMNFIASPEIVTAFAIARRLSFNPMMDDLTGADGELFRLSPPATAPEVPEDGFDPGVSAFIPPPDDGTGLSVNVDEASPRLQVMTPWPAWDGNDFEDLPILIKAQGKTMTDHISPAGPWLKLRGHLDKFSDNLLSGGTNAFTDEPGTAINVLGNKGTDTVANVARIYKAAGRKWVIVGDANYGEGSSREHAALSPRLLGGVAVIAKSFARIHESNLKKQGLLALTFQNPDAYDSLGAEDRLNLTGQDDLAPGKPVTCTVRRADGSTHTLRLNYTFSESQLGWFRSGSAVNLLNQSQAA